MNEWDARLLAIANKAVREAQDENRRKDIPLCAERDACLATS